jgi:hypothetical protein
MEWFSQKRFYVMIEEKSYSLKLKQPAIPAFPKKNLKEEVYDI